MGSLQATMTMGTPVVVPLPNPTGSIVLTQIGGIPAEVYVTADGSYPAFSSSTANTAGLRVLAGVSGAQIILQPPFFGDHMAAPVLRFASQGAPLIQIEW